MTGFRQAVRCVLCVSAVLTLTGCSTVEDRVASLRDNITKFEFPSLLGGKEENTSDATMTASSQPADTTTSNTESVVANNDGFTPSGFETEELAAITPAAGDGKVGAEDILTAPQNCPSISVVDDLKSLSQFKDPAAPSKANFISKISIGDAISGCSYNGDNVVLQMNIRFEGEIGPEGRVKDSRTTRISYPYFIAITTPQGNIISKEVHALTIGYGTDDIDKTQEERLRQILPLDGNALGPDHEILIGMQLTPQQLAFNRQQNEQLQDMIADVSASEIQQPVNVVPSSTAPEKTAAAVQPAPASAPVVKPQAKPAPTPVTTAKQESDTAEVNYYTAKGGDVVPPADIEPAAGDESADSTPPLQATAVSITAPANKFPARMPGQNTLKSPETVSASTVQTNDNDETEYPVYLYDRTFGH